MSSIPVPLNAFSAVPRGGGPIQTSFGITSAPGSRVAAYVRASGVQDGDDGFIANNLVADINTGLSRCRAGMYDTVYVLPDHTETVTTATALSNLVEGVNVVGLGSGPNRATVIWGATAAQWAIDEAGVCFSNFVFEMAGDPDDASALTVTNPISVTGGGCCFVGISARCSRDSGQVATRSFVNGSLAGGLAFFGCELIGSRFVAVTSLIANAGLRGFRMSDCTLLGATTSTTTGLLTIGASSDDIIVGGCRFVNSTAVNTSAVSGAAGIEGVFYDCGFGIRDDTTLVGFTTPGNVQMFGCKTANLAGENGADTTPVST